MSWDVGTCGCMASGNRGRGRNPQTMGTTEDMTVITKYIRARYASVWPPLQVAKGSKQPNANNTSLLNSNATIFNITTSMYSYPHTDKHSTPKSRRAPSLT
jgi:hypothetical protein